MGGVREILNQSRRTGDLNLSHYFWGLAVGDEADDLLIQENAKIEEGESRFSTLCLFSRSALLVLFFPSRSCPPQLDLVVVDHHRPPVAADHPELSPIVHQADQRPLCKSPFSLSDQIMDKNLTTVVDCETTLKMKKPKFGWDNRSFMAFVDSCVTKNAHLSVFDEKYALLFRDSVVVGDQTMTPLQFQNNSNPNGENVEGKGDSDDINLDDDVEPLFPSFHESSSTKKRSSKLASNNRSTKSKSSVFEEKVDALLDAISTKSTQTYPQNNPSPTIAECMAIVTKFPDFHEGSNEFSQALFVFTKKQNCEAFMFPTTDEAKMGLSLNHSTSQSSSSSLMSATCDTYNLSGQELRYQHCSAWVSLHFTMETYSSTYAEVVFPVPVPAEYKELDEVMIVLPPLMDKRQAVRPKNHNRITSQCEGPIQKKM
ncbi:unnamed protein product [Lactuca saligna]|uniref:Uncharacterized protein n=1 Tax=Lactuca saligna TaxID=75948 RepID=A0AA36DXP6_LACSI|nr:unnamed protein product [Lactuca saligna]